MLRAILLIFLAAFLFLLLWSFFGVIRVRYFPSREGFQFRVSGAGAVSRQARHVEELAGRIGSRSVHEYGKLEEAKEYIAETLMGMGFQPEFQRYEYEGREYSNVIGTLSGKGADPSWVVIGAHYDTVWGTPGADDNGSAVAMLLETARMLRGRVPDRTVKIVFFTLEEPPAFRTAYMGSYVFARAARDRGQAIHAMVCLEMLGFFGDEKGKQSFPFPFMKFFYPTTPNFIAVVGNGKFRKLVRAVADSLRRNGPVPVESICAPSVIPGIDFSDHRSFWKMGFPAVMITDTAFYRNPFYHTEGDTPKTLDFQRMEDLLPAIAAVVRELADGP